MTGMELCRSFWEQYGAPAFAEFHRLMDRIAVGLAGPGSECLGFDDPISRDHDFEPGFCLFLPGEEEIGRREAFALSRAYEKLPREFLGVSRSPVSPVGGSRHGVIRMSDFLLRTTGTPDGKLSLRGWLSVPEQSLLEASGGQLWRDDSGRFTAIRESLARLPEDIRRKKLAGRLLLMGQAGQYNYPRCVTRGETGAAQLAAFAFAESAMHAAFLLAGSYMPYYKWRFRALRELAGFSGLAEPLEQLISSGNTAPEAARKTEIIREVCAVVIGELRAAGLSDYGGDEAEGHAYRINEGIGNGELRNEHILSGV